MLSRLIDLRLEPAVRSLFGHVAPGLRNSDDVARARQRITTELAVIEWALDPTGPFAIDGSISMADCSIAATSTWLKALRPDLLPGLPLPPRFERVVSTLLNDPITGPPIAVYGGLVADWVINRRDA
jgi:glutathione S-transferase